MTDARTLLVLYGSETGNAQVRLGTLARRSGTGTDARARVAGASPRSVSFRVSDDTRHPRARFRTRSRLTRRFPRNDVVSFALSRTTNARAQDVAERVAREASKLGFAPSVLAMDAFEVTELPAARRAVFVTSTMGQGDPPSNARSFWKFLLRKSLPADSLRALSFACFGLGDSHYAKYNVAAKKLHRRLTRLGATSVVDLGLGDDQHPAGYDHALDPWLAGLWRALGHDADAAKSGGASRNTTSDDERSAAEDECRFAVFQETATSRFDDAVDARPSVETLHAVAAAFDALAETAAPVDRRWRKKRGTEENAEKDSSCFGVVASLRALTSETAVARSAHVEIRLERAPASYDVGDCLEVLPFAVYDARAKATGYGKLLASREAATEEKENGTATSGDDDEKNAWSLGADAVLRRAGVDPRAFVRVSARQSKAGETEENKKNITVPARHLVLACLDIASASPRRYFYSTAARFASSADEKERLEYFASAEGRDDARRYGERERRTLLEFFDDFPSVAVPLGWLLQTAPRLRPRLFSIASSRAADGPDAVHLVVTRAAWTTPYGRERKGLCSSQLTNDEVFCVEESRRDRSPPQRETEDATAAPRERELVGFLREDARLAARVVKGAVAFPDDAQPTVAVCTGSGVAPVRAMVRQRDARFRREKNASERLGKGKGKGSGSVARTLVFFGCRHASRDFLYAEEWAALAARGTLRGDRDDEGVDESVDDLDDAFVPVFSRDGDRKRYVSHAVRDRSKSVWDVLRRDRSAVVICGSSGAMPEDVHEALVDVCAREGGMDDAQARAFLRGMDARGGYVVEAW